MHRRSLLQKNGNHHQVAHTRQVWGLEVRGGWEELSGLCSSWWVLTSNPRSVSSNIRINFQERTVNLEYTRSCWNSGYEGAQCQRVKKKTFYRISTKRLSSECQILSIWIVFHSPRFFHVNEITFWKSTHLSKFSFFQWYLRY